MSIYIYRKMKLFWVIICLLASFQLRAEITFTSAEQVVEKEGKIALSVSGTVGALTWSAQKGWIEGNSTMVIYTAPPQAGWDGVMVMDAEGNVATLKIQIKASVENANWQVFTNRDSVNALALSKDKATLWVGSEGGLEKRDATTGESKRFFLSSNGFPSNEIQAIVNDNKGGLWVGTAGGLAHVEENGTVKAFTTQKYGLPNDLIKSLLADGNGGVWIGAQFGVSDLAHLDADGKWEIFKEEDSGLKNYAYCLLSDDKKGIWMGNHRGLIHFDGKKGWTVFNTENSQLPDNTVLSLESDGNNGLWVGTEEGLAHFHPETNTWSNVDHSKLPSHEISAIQSDGKGGIWLGTDKGLVQFQAGTIGQIYSVDNSELPSNQITAIESDGNGGLWLGTSKGIAHLKSDENSLILLGSKHFSEKSTLPSNDIQVLSSSQAGIWVGTDNGWASWDKAEQRFESFHSEDFSTVFAIESDNAGGVWLGTEKGVFHKFNDDNQALFNTKDSDLRVYSFLDAGEEIWAGTNFGLFKLAADNLQGRILEGIPDIHVKAIQPDDKGGIWVGLGRVVLHIKADNTKTPFNFELQINADTTRQFHFKNSDMPNKWIRSLHADGDGGVWVGLGGDATFRPEGVEDPGNCLVHIRAEGDLKVIERDDSGPQLCRILSIQKDGKQGIWVGFGSGGKNVNGKFFGGLGHLDASRHWQFFDTNNSSLPINDVTSLLSDENESDGIWVGTSSGLAHIKLGEQQSGNRAAIIIAGGGTQETNTLWDTTNSISSYFYKMLDNRKFINSEIYYLSPQYWADFNGDGKNDDIVDASDQEGSLNLDDIKKAFEWAKEKEQLDQPLYVFFVDHGGPGKLQIAKNTQMSAEYFKGILDDYQEKTGNKVVVILEACHSGSFLPLLAYPNRAIISSAKGNEKAYFEGKQGFSSFFSKSLLKGMNFLEAFKYTVKNSENWQPKAHRLSGASAESEGTTQTPQFDDNGDGLYNDSDGEWLKQLQMNGNFLTGDFTLAVESLTVSGSVQVGQPFSLRAKASTVSGHVKRVWAVIRPPRINLVIDSNGTPILAYPTQALSQTEEQDIIWTGSWNQAVYNGDYDIRFYAEDNEGNIEMSEKAVVISVSGGVEPPPEASVEVVIEKNQYTRGESFQFQLVEQLGWGYDLYAAVVLPDGGFITLEGPNQFAQLNQAEKWRKPLKYNEKVTAIDMALPSDLPMGSYCLYGILSPQGEEPMVVRDKWVSSQQCFEVM